MKNTNSARRGFTLLELLVVVLIIGILAVVALSQYRKAVEKAIMTEAITNVRAIAQAHQLYYLANNSYVGSMELDLLDVTLLGVTQVISGDLRGRWKSKYFVYAPTAGAYVGLYLAHARRYVNNADDKLYAIYIKAEDPTRVSCASYADITPIQNKLCKKLRETGFL